MEEAKNKISEFRIIIEEIFKERINLIKLNVIEFLSLLFASFFNLAILTSLVLMAMVFTGIGLALWFNQILDSTFLGFFIVAVIFVGLFITSLVLSAKKGYPMFTDIFVKIFVSIFYDQDEKD